MRDARRTKEDPSLDQRSGGRTPFWAAFAVEVAHDDGQAKAHLQAGREIYFREDDTPAGLVVKECPDGRRELVLRSTRPRSIGTYAHRHKAHMEITRDRHLRPGIARFDRER